MDKRGAGMANSFDDLNRQSLEDLRAFLGQLSDDQLQQPLDDGWTVSAVLGHVAYWDRRAAQYVIRLTKDGNFRSSGEDVHVVNDALLHQWRRIPAREAVAEVLEAGEEVNGKIAGLDEETAQKWLALRIFALDRSDHRLEHLEELKGVFA
jgi:Mycothiol maleylpyruvate isomerase N-terminal domain